MGIVAIHLTEIWSANIFALLFLLTSQRRPIEATLHMLFCSNESEVRLLN